MALYNKVNYTVNDTQHGTLHYTTNNIIQHGTLHYTINDII